MSDFISREAAIEYFMINTNWHDEEGYSIDDWYEKRKLLEDYFNGVPSAEPEPDDCIPITWLEDYTRNCCTEDVYLMTLAIIDTWKHAKQTKKGE